MAKVKQCIYLGSIITTYNKCHHDIKARITMGKEAFNKRLELISGKLNINLKKRMTTCLDWSVVPYGTGTLIMPKRFKKKIEAFEMWARRRI